MAKASKGMIGAVAIVYAMHWVPVGVVELYQTDLLLKLITEECVW